MLTKNPQVIISCFLILIGTVVMSLSIIKFRKLFAVVKTIPRKDKRSILNLLKIHISLMIFFLIGYIIVGIAFYLNLDVVSNIFVGIIFMLGAFFVLINVMIQVILNDKNKEMIEILSQSENYLKTIFDSVQAGVILIDTETHKIVDINPIAAKMFGADKNKIINSICHQYICPAEKGKCPITDLGQTIDNSEKILLRADSTKIPILKTVIPVTLNNKKILLESFLDLSERKQTEKEKENLQTKLMQSEKMAAIGQLAGGVAHEINNPMGVILGFAQLIAKEIKEDNPLYIPLKSIEKEAVRCKKLIGDLLTFSRTGKTEIEKANINEVIENAISIIAGRAKIKKIEIKTNYADNLPYIPININKIQQVIINLCNNAIDAMPEGGVIKIATKKNENQVEIIVIDTGKGMTEEIKKHLFEPFYTTKEVGKGTGLGLSLCYETIQKHNGKIEVESETGKGTIFKIKLPIS